MFQEEEVHKKSFRDSMLGADSKADSVSSSHKVRDSNMDDSVEEADFDDFLGLAVIEGKLGIYDCPTFLLS